MRKKYDLFIVGFPLIVILGIILFLILDTPKIEAAELKFIDQVENEKSILDSKILELDNTIFSIPIEEEERAVFINERIALEKEKNKLTAYSEAYINLIELEQENELTYSYSGTGEAVPGEYIQFYKAAGAKYNIDWSILAAIHKIETNFSRIERMVSTVGAIGHMQFMPPTWAYYGVDGNNDLRIDPWNLEDSIFSAANYLSASGYSKDVRGAIWHYNHAEWYVNDVLETAARFKMESE